MNRNTTLSSRVRGFVLIEAMIALVVLSFGIISIAKLQSELLASSGYTKARAEAVQIAEREMERLRNMVAKGQWDGVCEEAPTSITGTNAAFTISCTQDDLSGPDLEGKTINLTISWDDPKAVGQEIILISIIAWDDPILSLLASGGGETGGGSGLVDPPRGAAQMGGELPDDAPTLAPGSIPEEYVAEDGRRLLLGLDSSGDTVVLMTIDDGSAFSTIAGTAYIDQTANPEIAISVIQLHSSDAVHCYYDSTDLTNWPTTGTLKYKSFDYKCWIGARWYGNIGVVYTGNNPPRACVGDPLIATYQGNDDADNTPISTSRQPWPSTARGYRGYKNVGLPLPISSGMGININAVTDPYAAQHYTEQNFLLTRFNLPRNPTNQDFLDACKDKMELLETGVPSSSPMARKEGDGPATHTGQFVCLSDLKTEPENSTCPAALPTGAPPITEIALTINLGDVGVRGNIVGLTLTDGGCSDITGKTGTGGREASSTCTINWRGSTIAAGATVDAVLSIELATGHVLCSTTGDGEYTGVQNDLETVTFSVGPVILEAAQTLVVRSSDGSCP